MKKKLLIVSDSPILNTGLARCVRETASRLSQVFEVRIAGWYYYPQQLDYPFFIYPLQKGNDPNFGVILADFKPDLILAIGDIWDFAFFLQFQDKIFNKAILWTTVDGENLRPGWSDIINLFVKVASFTEFGKEVILRTFGLEREVTVIPPGVNKETFFPFPENVNPNVKSAVDLKNSFVVLSVAQNTDRKNLPLTIEAFGEFAKDKPDAYLFLVTNPADPEGYDLWPFIKRTGVSKRILVTRDISVLKGISDSALNQIYNFSNVLLNNSLGEGWGLPLLEAMATQRPIVAATDYAAATEIVKGRGELIKVGEFIYGVYGIKRAIASKKDVIGKLNYLYKDWKSGGKKTKAKLKKAYSYAMELTWERTADRIKKLADAKSQIQVPSVDIKGKELNMLMVVPSWGKNCGIAEYSKDLTLNLEKVAGKEIAIFPSNDLKSFSDYILKKDFNLIHFQHEYSFFPTYYSLIKVLKELKKRKIKSVVTFHSWSNLASYNKLLLPYFDTVIVHGQSMKDKFLKHAPQANIQVIPMGCKPPVQFNSDELKKNLSLTGFPLIGSFGFLRDQKNFANVLRAVGLLRNEYPSAQAIIHSPPHEFGSDVYDRKFFLSMGAEGHLKYSTIFREYLQEEEMIKTLACADIIVLPYLESPAGGGFSASLKTCLRTGKPVLTSNTSYFEDMDKEIFRFDDLTAVGIKNALLYVLKHPDVQKELVEKGNKFLQKNSWEKVAKKHLLCYNG